MSYRQLLSAEGRAVLRDAKQGTGPAEGGGASPRSRRHAAMGELDAPTEGVIQLLQKMVQQRSLFGHKLTDAAAAFDAMDVDRSGALSRDELRVCIGRLGLGLSEEQHEALASALDVDKDGSVDRYEFLARVGTRRQRREAAQVLAERRAIASVEVGDEPVVYEPQRHRPAREWNPEAASEPWRYELSDLGLALLSAVPTLAPDRRRAEIEEDIRARCAAAAAAPAAPRVTAHGCVVTTGSGTRGMMVS
jgi:hypothetical protein